MTLELGRGFAAASCHVRGVGRRAAGELCLGLSLSVQAEVRVHRQLPARVRQAEPGDVVDGADAGFRVEPQVPPARPRPLTRRSEREEGVLMETAHSIGGAFFKVRFEALAAEYRGTLRRLVSTRHRRWSFHVCRGWRAGRRRVADNLVTSVRGRRRSRLIINGPRES